MAVLVQSPNCALPPANMEGMELYNVLPNLGTSDDTFNARARTLLFPKIGALLGKFDCIWGLCLVHTHCALNSGETMVTQGNICQPEKVLHSDHVYPERWLC